MEERLDQAQLRERLDAATGQVEAGGRYMHYKRLRYTVIAVALLEATNEPAVIYRADYGEHITFIRPLSDWLAVVTVDGKQVPRFTRVD